MASHSSDFAPFKRGSAPSTTPGSLEPWLRTSILAFGFGKLAFFLPIRVLLPFRPQLPPDFAALVRWGPGGSEQYEEMIAAIYIVWGVFLVRAGARPWENVLFLDFTVWGNVMHIGLMTIMAVINKGDRVHLVGDVLAAWLFLGPFIYIWTSVKREHKPILGR